MYLHNLSDLLPNDLTPEQRSAFLTTLASKRREFWTRIFIAATYSVVGVLSGAPIGYVIRDIEKEADVKVVERIVKVEVPAPPKPFITTCPVCRNCIWASPPGSTGYVPPKTGATPK